MKRKIRDTAKRAAVQREPAQATRQDAVPLVGAVAPPPPSNARWQVMEWCKVIQEWKHFGYASNDREKRRLGDTIRRMGGKATYRALAFSGMTVKPPISEPPPTGTKPPQPRVSQPPMKDAEYRARLLSSLSLWIKEVRDADALPDLPVKTIRAARDACKYIVERRIGEGGYRGRGDPFAGLE